MGTGVSLQQLSTPGRVGQEVSRVTKCIEGPVFLGQPAETCWGLGRSQLVLTHWKGFQMELGVTYPSESFFFHFMHRAFRELFFWIGWWRAHLFCCNVYVYLIGELPEIAKTWSSWVAFLLLSTCRALQHHWSPYSIWGNGNHTQEAKRQG